MIDLLPNSNYIKNFVRRLGREGFFSCFIIFQWPKILASWPVISLGLFFPPEKLALLRQPSGYSSILLKAQFSEAITNFMPPNMDGVLGSHKNQHSK